MYSRSDARALPEAIRRSDPVRIRVPSSWLKGYRLFLFSPRPHAFSGCTSPIAATALTVSVSEREQFQRQPWSYASWLLGRIRAWFTKSAGLLLRQRLGAAGPLCGPENLALDLRQMMTVRHLSPA
jgi:hypothetical protein